jgi:hypothetical protein
VNDSPDRWKRPIENKMGRRVRRWPKVAAPEDAAIEKRYDNKFFRPKLIIRDATGLDDHHAGLAIHGAGVAERQSHKPVADQSEVGSQDLFAQLGKGTSKRLAHV